ncbi:MAG: glycosyltransferase, partial [Pseudomonadota bacterium]|nr:glycosyltransferase [Pseudomonadota bacterium]
LVIADSDIHTPPDTLRSIVSRLSAPGVGLVTALYTGLPADCSLVGRIGAAHINLDFLPGTLLARAMGRQDCLGAIMGLTRATLERVGGLEALADHVADDALLGQLVRQLGLSVALADVVPATTVPETTLSALYTHELRWMRTVKSVAPIGFVLSSIQYPLFWSMLMMLVSGFEPWTFGVFAGAWLVRGILAHALDRMLQIAAPLTIWSLPLRDLLSVLVMLASYGSNRVAWRGQTHNVTSFTQAVLQPGKG